MHIYFLYLYYCLFLFRFYGLIQSLIAHDEAFMQDEQS